VYQQSFGILQISRVEALGELDRMRRLFGV
jgi:hypothetical protein